MSDDTPPLSERLQGIADAFTVRAAIMLAQSRGRMTPESMDELRMWIGVAVRGAAIEGARNPGLTLGELIPVPKTGRANAREFNATRRDTPKAKVPPPPPPPPPKSKSLKTSLPDDK